MSSIVCPACNAYLGLGAAGAAECPKCAAPLSAPPAEAPTDCPAHTTSDGGNDVVIGGLWLIGGIAVTVGTYMIAEESGGGRYIVAWGAMLAGGIQFLRGLFSAGRRQVPQG